MMVLMLVVYLTLLFDATIYDETVVYSRWLGTLEMWSTGWALWKKCLIFPRFSQSEKHVCYERVKERCNSARWTCAKNTIKLHVWTKNNRIYHVQQYEEIMLALESLRSKHNRILVVVCFFYLTYRKRKQFFCSNITFWDIARGFTISMDPPIL